VGGSAVGRSAPAFTADDTIGIALLANERKNKNKKIINRIK